MTTHAQARSYARESLASEFHEEPTQGEVSAEAGVASLETSYGDGWKGPGKGSNNQGAIQCGSGWKGDRFSYIDTHPNPDGTSTPYRIDFRKYPTPNDGWRDLCRVVYINRGRSIVRASARVNDWLGVSRGLHSTGYYEGFGKTVEDRIRNHYRALSRAIAKADGDVPPIIVTPTIMPTVERGDGMSGAPNEAVRLLQYELQLAADGRFGPATEAAVKAYQDAHGIIATGICNAQTWDALFHDDYIPARRP